MSTKYEVRYVTDVSDIPDEDKPQVVRAFVDYLESRGQKASVPWRNAIMKQRGRIGFLFGPIHSEDILGYMFNNKHGAIYYKGRCHREDYIHVNVGEYYTGLYFDEVEL
jgi:hypothetical protein